uniref:RBR-type E3 ubiquitin transferase n=1 Tax=Macrostomum lignano TaxID=282301 RepID=A0A1I8FF16_9PLAT
MSSYPAGYCGPSLSKYRWDKDLLLEAILRDARAGGTSWARHNIPAVRPKNCGSSLPLPPSPAPAHRRRSGTQTVICEICCQSRPIAAWWQRLPPRVLRGLLPAPMSLSGMLQAGQFEGLQCPPGLRLLEGFPKLRGQFQKALVTTLSPCNRRLGLLPPRGRLQCVVRLLDDAVRACRVTCRCGKTFSSPALSCSMLRRWQQKNAGESMSTQWFMAKHQGVPKCHATIEKNGGCNHMKCRNATCNHEFCWVCMDDWQPPHGKEWYNCNRASGARPPAAALSRNYLSRYLHYYDLYMNHLKSLEFEARLQRRMHSKMDEMQIPRAQLRSSPAISRKSSRTISRNLQLATGRSQRAAGTGNTAARMLPSSSGWCRQVRFCETRSAALLDHVYEATACPC